MGNFADVQVAGEFRLIFVVFNTFFGLVTQEEQVRCFQNVAAHLGPGGTFVIEVFVPDMNRFSGGQELRTREVTTERVSLQASLHDPVSQRVKSQYIVFSNNQVNNYPIEIRYCWPSELDLMAQLAGCGCVIGGATGIEANSTQPAKSISRYMNARGSLRGISDSLEITAFAQKTPAY